MTDARKTGAYIARLRKQRDWTQVDLADRLSVTHQAVSRWETGSSFPDIVTLPRVAQLFGVPVDDLLHGGPVAQPQEPAHVTTGDIVIALAEGRPEQVARLVRERRADLAALIDVAQLTPPHLVTRVIAELAEFPFTLEQLGALAPHLSQEIVRTLLDRAFAGDLDRAVITTLAPFLEEALLAQTIERFVAGELDAWQIGPLLPFLSLQTRNTLIAGTLDGALGPEVLASLAPHLEPERLEAIARRLAAQPHRNGLLRALAPFLSQDMLQKLLRP